MTNYTQEQLLKAVEYGRRVQKNEDYNIARLYMVGSEDIRTDIKATLDDLYSDNLQYKITIEEIDEYLNEQK